MPGTSQSFSKWKQIIIILLTKPEIWISAYKIGKGKQVTLGP